MGWGGEENDVPLPLYVHMGPNVNTSVIFCLSQPYFLKEGLLLNIDFTILSRVTGWRAPRSLLSPLTRARITEKCYETHILYGCWALKSGPCACTPSTLPIKSSLQLLFLSILTCFMIQMDQL